MSAQPAAGEPAGSEGIALAFSVVVPVFDQWHLIPRLLASLEAQTLPRSRFEIILVDNGSAEAPPLAVEGATVLRCAQPGSYAARNVGAAAARAPWLVFTDADCVASPGWLEAFAAAPGDASRLLAGPVCMFSASQRPGASEIYDIVKGIPQERYLRRGYAATANLAVPRAVFARLGGFDAARFSGGDAEFCRRAGPPPILVPAAVVHHPARISWREVSTKARRVKGGQMMQSSRWRHRTLLGTFVPPVYGLWYFLTDTRHSLWRRLVASAVLCRVWAVDVAEAIRIRRGKAKERR